MNGSIQQKVALSIGLVSFILCLAIGFIYNSVTDFIQTGAQVLQSRQILQDLNNVRVGITQAETGQRGYLLTQRSSYLTPYITSIHDIQRSLDDLHLLAKEDIQLGQQLKLLDPAIRLKLNELQRTIDLNRTVGKDAAMRIVMTDEGRKLMDLVYSIIGNTINAEDVLLLGRQQRNLYNQQITFVALPLSGFIIFFMLGLVYWVVSRESVRREKAQQELDQLNQVLQKNMSLLNSIIENVPGMIFLKDAKELRFQLFNKAAEQIVGFSSEEVLGKNDYDFFLKEQADYFTSKDRQTLTLKTLVNIEEEEISTKQGQIRILRTKKVPILNEKGDAAYLLGISQDITEFKRTQEHIQQLNHRLEGQVTHLNTLNKELESFSYSVSHDLRTPLRSIDGFSQAILESAEDKLDETEKDYLRRVRTSSQQMAQLIDDLLNLSQVTRAELNIDLHVNLSDIVCDIATELQRLEPDRHANFEIEEGIIVKGDSGLLKVALHNLVCNAWKFTSRQPEAVISFKSYQQEGIQVFALHDNGAGFNMAYAPKLFEAFQRLHTNKEFPGTGIGLAIVQKIITRHRGKIWAEAQVGQGATFYFTLGNVQQEEARSDNA